MTGTAVAVALLVIAAVATLVFLLRGGRRPSADVPPVMRPAFSDDQLERRVLERYMAWGVVLTGFFALFLPGYFLQESHRLNEETDSFFVESVVRGEEIFTTFCAECHGAEGEGGAAPSPYGNESWPAPDLTTIAVRYEDNENIADIEEFVRQTIEQGRPGTPMPTWGAAYDGPLDDQQVDDLVNWILAHQVAEESEPVAATGQSGEQLFMANCAKCHGKRLQGVVGPPLHNEFERHTRKTILGILQNGIYMPTGTPMPPWQAGYTYEGARYTDGALRRIIDYVESRQSGGGSDGAVAAMWRGR